MAELIHKLGIEWKLLAAQVVNFLVLLFLLKKFLYGPIIELLAKRRKGIEESTANAERIAKELTDIEIARMAELDKAKKDADAILREARKIAKEKSAELVKETEMKIEQLIREAKRQIGEERAKMLQESGADIKELVFMVTEKVLQERLPKDVDAKFVQAAIVAVQKK